MNKLYCVLLILALATIVIDAKSHGKKRKGGKEGRKEGKEDCRKLVAFGDSLTDNGVGTNDDQGIKPFSNGDLWPEYLGKLLGCKRVDDRANSGARSGMDNLYFNGWSGGVWQVDKYIKEGKIKPKTIIAWECTGANDLLYHMAHKSINPKTLVPEIITNNANNLKKLLQAGVKKIVIMDLFEGEAYSPESKLDPASTPLILQIVGAINAGIGQTIAQLKTAFPDVVIGHFATAKVWKEEIVPNFPIIDVPFSHKDPNMQYGDVKKYVWYDTLHLMSGVHEILAKNMKKALTEAKG